MNTHPAYCCPETMTADSASSPVRLFRFILLLSFLITITGAPAAEFWVSPNGDDGNPGTRAEPMKSPALALRAARELRRLDDPSLTNGVRIILGGGRYHLTEPLVVHPEDSGTPTHPTRFDAESGESPVLSGGVRIINWQQDY